MTFRRWALAPGAIAGVALGLSLLAAPAVHAQNPEGYLIGTPRVTVTLKGLFDQPRAQSEIFDFTTDLLTLERDDFRGLGGGLAVNVRITDHFDLGAELLSSGSSTRSEFRDFVEVTDAGEIPIEQTTTFDRRSFIMSGRVFPLPRGRSVGSFAWIPSTIAPYLGAGVGWTSYDFIQEGDFVDVESLDIFEDYLQTKGSGWTQHAFAGLEFGIGPRFLATLEGRYSWGALETGGDYDGDFSRGTNDFVGFDATDLTGFQIAVGFGIRL